MNYSNITPKTDYLNAVIYITYLLSSIGTFIGLLLFLSTINASPKEFIEDDLPNFTLFFRFVGQVFICVGIFSLIGNYLLSKLNRVGWLMIIGVYTTGLILTIYIIYKWFINSWFRIGLGLIPLYLGLFILCIMSLYTLTLHSKTLKLFFRKNEIKYINSWSSELK
ncbi:MAG: hypothetical protein ACXAC7_01960 [Candidatus Hodarchaeales archaeon]|jgi:hypothetical protein